MRSNHWRNGVLLAVLGPVLLAAGCTGTEVLETTTQPYVFELEVINLDTRFEIASFKVVQVELRPMDPDADAALLATGVGLLKFPVEMDYRLTTLEQSSLSLPDGVYRLHQIRMNPVKYEDIVDRPTSAATCEDYVYYWEYSERDLVFFGFGEDVLVTVKDGQPNQFKLVVDGQQFLRAFQESWLCRDIGFGRWELIPGSFNRSGFTARYPEFFEFQ